MKPDASQRAQVALRKSLVSEEASAYEASVIRNKARLEAV